MVTLEHIKESNGNNRRAQDEGDWQRPAALLALAPTPFADDVKSNGNGNSLARAVVYKSVKKLV